MRPRLENLAAGKERRERPRIAGSVTDTNVNCPAGCLGESTALFALRQRAKSKKSIPLSAASGRPA